MTIAGQEAFEGMGEAIKIYNVTHQGLTPMTCLYTYTSREYDPESGLYFYRARYYDETVGRFISEDPIGFDGGSINLYSYVNNGPVNVIDPLGLFGFFGPGLQNIRPQDSKPPCKSPYDECIDNANKFRSKCTKLMWAAQAGCAAICAVGCIDAGPGYGACLWRCFVACHEGFKVGKRGCWASYAALVAACHGVHK